MKILLKLSALVFACLFSTLTYSQSFEKGNKIIDAGIKISIYSVSNSNESDEDDDGNAALSYTIPIGFEYAIGKSIGVGAEVGICNFFAEEDSVSGVKPEAKSFDVLIKGNFHWVKSSRVNLSSGLGIGFSDFTYKSKDAFDSEFNSTVPYLRVSLLNFKVYFSKNIGLGAAIGIPYMNFNNGRITDQPGSDFNYPLSLVGFDIGTGLVVKF